MARRKLCHSIVQPKQEEPLFLPGGFSWGHGGRNKNNWENSTLRKKKKDEREWKKQRWNNSDWTGHIHLMESAPVLWQSVFPRWDVFPLHTWDRYGSKQAFFLPHQWVTKPANLLVQQSVLLCGISRSNWDSCGKFFARLLIVTMSLTLSSDNSNSRGSSFKSRCELEIKLLFISNSNRNQTLFCFHSFNSRCDW